MLISSDWRSRIKAVLERFKRYWAVLSWLLRDLWRFGRRRLLVMVGASFLSRTLLGSTFVVLIAYLHALEKGKASWLRYLPEGMAISDLFWPVALAGSALFIISSLIDFVVVRQVIDISARHSVDLSRRCLAMIAPVLSGVQGFGSQPYPQDTVWISTNGADILMRATRITLRSVSPFFQLFYAVLLLMTIEPVAALVVALIALPSMSFAYLINSQILQNEYLIPEVNRRRRQIATEQAKFLAGQDSFPSELPPQKWEEQHTVTFHDAARLRSERVVHKERCRTLSNLIIGIGLLVVMSMLGYEALIGNRSWTTVITFIVLLRVAGGSLGGILSALAFISRLYPTLRRIPVYLRDPAFSPAVKSCNRLKIKNSLGIGNLKKISIRPGSVFHVYADVPLSPLNLWFFIYSLSAYRWLKAVDLMERTVLFGSETALHEHCEDKEDQSLRLVLIRAELWHRIGDKASSRFPGSPLIVCHANVRQEFKNQGPGNETWIIPAKNGQTGLCTSVWMADHLTEINEILRQKLVFGGSHSEDDEEEE